MENDKKTISAAELNKYVYCPYRWYYERYYGKTQLKELRNDYLAKLGVKVDPTKSKLVKGQKFHDSFMQRYTIKVRVKQLTFAVILLVLVFLYYYFLMS